MVDRWGSVRPARLPARALAPGVCTYLLLAGALAAFFGPRSLLATALPVTGMKLYRASGFGALTTLIEFLHPKGAGLKYYITGRATWWMVGTLMLVGLGSLAAKNIVRQRRMDRRNAFVAIAATIQLAFALAAYGSSSQHVIYDPVLAAGVLVGLASLESVRLRVGGLAVFALLGVLGHWSQAGSTLWEWRTTRPAAETSGLYAATSWREQWLRILDLSSTHRLLLLSYGTGVHHYFPTVRSPEAWFLLPGVLLPADKRRLLAQLDDAEVVVEDRNGPTMFVDSDEEVQRRLAPMCLSNVTDAFRIWWRSPADGIECLESSRISTESAFPLGSHRSPQSPAAPAPPACFSSPVRTSTCKVTNTAAGGATSTWLDGGGSVGLLSWKFDACEHVLQVVVAPVEQVHPVDRQLERAPGYARKGVEIRRRPRARSSGQRRAERALQSHAETPRHRALLELAEWRDDEGVVAQHHRWRVGNGIARPKRRVGAGEHRVRVGRAGGRPEDALARFDGGRDAGAGRGWRRDVGALDGVEDQVLVEPRREGDDGRLHLARPAPVLPPSTGFHALDRRKRDALSFGEEPRLRGAEAFAVARENVHAAARRVIRSRLALEVKALRCSLEP